MVRTQIQITPEQARRLRAAARRDDISISEVVRRCLDAVLSDDDALSRRYERAATLVGAFRDAPDTALSTHHDEHLAAAFSEQPPR